MAETVLGESAASKEDAETFPVMIHLVRAQQVQVFAESKRSFNLTVDVTLNSNLYQCRTELIGQES